MAGYYFLEIMNSGENFKVRDIKKFECGFMLENEKSEEKGWNTGFLLSGQSFSVIVKALDGFKFVEESRKLTSLDFDSVEQIQEPEELVE